MDKKAWIVSVNMGYGHQRTAYPLRDLAVGGKIINANDYEGIPEKDRRIWVGSRKFYEFISNFSRIPLIGPRIFSIYNHFQEIFSFYPKKDLSEPNLALRQIYSLIKKGWGKDLILRLGSGQVEKSLPIISTFFTPVFMAEYFNYPGDIFCVICDADISRAWAPFNPRQSRIRYFAPNYRVVKRLALYGVRPENIFLTGYPLPKENIGDESLNVLKGDLRRRLWRLDPKRKYLEKYQVLVRESLGGLPEPSLDPLTIMFSIGGAGAQKDIAIKIVKNLAGKIKAGEIKIILSVGVKRDVKNYFVRKLGDKIEMIFGDDIGDYFKNFNSALRKTDILWTKPSELSLYSALGLPIIIAPPIGSQEEFNMRWLLKSGFGIVQENLNYLQQWLFDWLNNGYLAEAAMQGFVEGEKLGTFNIMKTIQKF
ncbi:MAG: hypothetical protein V1705_02320 [bacterium]